jgi:integrase
VSQTGVPFSGNTVLKLASHLALSRHGIYYFRLTYSAGSATKEKRISLRTKNPQEARLKASCLSAIMVTSKLDKQKTMDRDTYNAAQSLALEEPANGNYLERLLHRVDKQQLAQLTGRSLGDIETLLNPSQPQGTHKLELELPGGMVFRDINSDEDVGRVHQILKSLNLSPEALAQLIAGPNPQKLPSPAFHPDPFVGTTGEEGDGAARILQPPINHAKPQPAQVGGTTIQEMVPRYATRKRNKLSSKALYEYGNYHRKFVQWLELRKKNKHIPVHAITRADVADYIDDLLNDGLSERTVSQKYLPAINGLFDLAQTMGLIPEGQVVSRGHKIFSKADFKKASANNGYKSFNEEDLKTIFQSKLLKDAERPADFWLPMLGLFTGGRISELAQLDVADIQKHGEIWGISINDEGDKQLKTLAAMRLIPLHPVLLSCGFLDYVEDAKACGPKLFGYLTPDRFGSWGGTPSERWGKYMDGLGIKDPQKVFHSFRSTSNTLLKNNGVGEESRCQFIGHEHDTVNSRIYSDPHKLPFLLENVASKLVYPMIDFSTMVYAKGQFSEMLKHLIALKARRLAHEQAKAQRMTVDKTK